MPRPLVFSWAVRMSRADSVGVLDGLMDDWYSQVRADRGLHAAVGFDSSMERRDWDGAKGSIERTYGRSSRDHQGALDTLAAAIQCKRMLRVPAVR
ncbi:MAG TPA: hypothetical protein VGI97_06720 [Gemmatimonadaceae bacterium]